MKTRTNQPVYKDNGALLEDSDLGDKLPAIEEGDAGKVLMVNEGEDGYELGSELPAIEQGDAGKVLMVNEGETGYELGEVSSGDKLYQHTLEISRTQPAVRFVFTFLNREKNAYTKSTIGAYLFTLPNPTHFLSNGWGNNKEIYGIICRRAGNVGDYVDIMYEDTSIEQNFDLSSVNSFTDYVHEI